MRVISETRLKEFWRGRKPAEESRRAETDMRAWLTASRTAVWRNWDDLKRTFGSADAVGNCVVFDVGNNRYRVIGRVFYGGSGRVYILKVMDHAEYDKQRWVDECRCHEPPPKRPAVRGTPPKASRGPRKGRS